MRFNNRELALLAQQDSGKFDKEGQLLILHKHDKLFNKKEAFVERFFRLRGNLLFYFKNKDGKSEPVGLLVLERCIIDLEVNEQVDFSFVIEFEGDDQKYTFAANCEEERDSWISALHIASYECMKLQLQSLREQVQAKTGHDPMEHMLPQDTGLDFETKSGISVDDPAMEISLSIEGLPNDSNGQPPSPCIVLYTIVPPQQQTWMQHNNTEMMEKNSNPHFLKTVGFGDSAGLEANTRVKATVFNVKERMTGTMSQIGQVIFTLNNILDSTDMNLTLTLSGPDSTNIGELHIMGWLNDSPGLKNFDLERSGDIFSGKEPEKKSTPMIARRRSKRLDTLKPICENIITRTFRFDTSNEGVKLLVYEYMGESKFTFELPIKLLKLFVQEEQERIAQLQDLGKLPPVVESYIVSDIHFRATMVSEYTDNVNLLACYHGPDEIFLLLRLPVSWLMACQNYQDISMSCISVYNQAAHHLSGHKGSTFKPSCKRWDKELEFVPINLHLQRMTVVNEETDISGYYDIITMGAFTAHARKFKLGGVSRMLQQLQDQYSPVGTLSKITKVKRACELLNTLLSLQTVIHGLCDRVCKEALQGDAESLQTATDALAKKVMELVRECESPILQESATKLGDLQEEAEAEQEAKLRHSIDSLPASNKDKSPEKTWRWSGSHFVKSPTVEPWDMTRVNTEASLVCLTSMVEDLVKNKSGAMDRPKWLGEISPAVIKMRSFVEIVCQRSGYFMSFLDLMEHKDNLKLLHTIRCRRDVIFSQSLTTLVTGVFCKIHSMINNSAFIENITKFGFLAEMEGLLSCHGDEMSMLEDMVVAVDDLSSVTFKFTEETPTNTGIVLSRGKHVKSGTFPDLNRHHVCVALPIKKFQFEKLPLSLRHGQEVKVTPVLFTVGINEQAFLAEKFGNTGLQESTNEASLGRLNTYIQDIEENIGLAEGQTGAGTITDLLKQLQYNVYNKKSKNVEVLHLAAELCRKLDGVRCTSCKSAKDRTAMAVTLEQVMVLQQDYDLASHVFNHALDCFRSEGVRRENTYKNVGSRKYAFNSLQLLSFPKQYRPPNGTYGNVQA